MATKKRTPAGSVDQWESRELGADEQYVGVATAEEEAALDAAVGLKAISIRVPVDLIDGYKAAGAVLGIGYQPLMRDAMTRAIQHYLKEAAEILSQRLVSAEKSPSFDVMKKAA